MVHIRQRGGIVVYSYNMCIEYIRQGSQKVEEEEEGNRSRAVAREFDRRSG